MNQEHKDIMKQTGLKPSACSCNKCVSMCKDTPCIGTPSDILTLINNGHISSLANTVWAAGIFQGMVPIEMVQLISTKSGCVMFDNLTGHCRLHSTGIKPIEGILANCNMEHHIQMQLVEKRPSAAVAVAKVWLNPSNKKTVRLIARAMKKITS